jgi:hypothetical protein
MPSACQPLPACTGDVSPFLHIFHRVLATSCPRYRFPFLRPPGVEKTSSPPALDGPFDSRALPCTLSFSHSSMIPVSDSDFDSPTYPTPFPFAFLAPFRLPACPSSPAYARRDDAAPAGTYRERSPSPRRGRDESNGAGRSPVGGGRGRSASPGRGRMDVDRGRQPQQ